MTTTITVATLRQACERLLDAIEQRHGAELHLDAGLYWTISSDPRQVHDEAVVGAGDLVDDLASVHDFVGCATDEPVAIWHEINHLTGVLTAIAALDQGPA